MVRDVVLKEAYSSEEAIMFAKDLIGDEPMTKEQIKLIEDTNKMPTMQKVLSGALNGRQVRHWYKKIKILLESFYLVRRKQWLDLEKMQNLQKQAKS